MTVIEHILVEFVAIAVADKVIADFLITVVVGFVLLIAQSFELAAVVSFVMSVFVLCPVTGEGNTAAHSAVAKISTPILLSFVLAVHAVSKLAETRTMCSA